MVPPVPPEIVLHVLSFVTWPDRKQTLLSCALVCRDWRPLAQSTLLTLVNFWNEPKLGRSEAVKGLVEAAGRERGGWRCDELDIAKLSLEQILNILECATAVKHICLDLRYMNGEDEAMCASVDWLAFGCMSELESLHLSFASTCPTRVKLAKLRALTFDSGCEADGALPSIIAAAPNLQNLDIQLDGDTPNTLTQCDSSLTKHLQHLFLGNKRVTKLEPSQFELVVKFVAECSANLKSVWLDYFNPIQHSAVLRAISSHLDRIDMWITMEDTDEFSSVGTELSKMALMKATQHAKKWLVGLWIDPPADEQLRSRPGPLVPGAWEDDKWAEWVAMCDERGGQLQVTSNVDNYNETFFPQTFDSTA